MKICSIPNFKTIIKTSAIVAPFLMTSISSNAINLNKTPKEDTVILSKDTTKIVPKGTTNPRILESAPSPVLFLNGKIQHAKFVVDLAQNALYHYNERGQAICAYLIASGKKSTPTETGVRIVTHVETYPYRTASPRTKRYKNPRDYGPKIICLRKIDLRTGETAPTGEFIHGNNNPKSLGNYASKGCMRMDNEVIKHLAKEVKKGDIVIIQR